MQRNVRASFWDCLHYAKLTRGKRKQKQNRALRTSLAGRTPFTNRLAGLLSLAKAFALKEYYESNMNCVYTLHNNLHFKI